VAETGLVIGGGIVGSAAAFFLAEAGLRVTLVDNEDPGAATLAGAGIVAPSASLRPAGPWLDLALAAGAFYPEFIAELRGEGVSETGFDTPGLLFLATDAAEQDKLGEVRQVISARRDAGAALTGDVTELDGAEVRRLFPPVWPGCRAVHVSGAGRVNGRTLLEALRAGLRRRGVTIISGRGTVRLGAPGAGGTTSAGGTTGRTAGAGIPGRAAAPRAMTEREWSIRVEGRPTRADVVVCATGAWTYGWDDADGVSVPVYPQRGQIVHLDMAPAPTGGWPIVTGFGSHYLVTFPKSRVVAGATREDYAGFDYRVTAGGQAEVLREALRVAPGLAAASVIETRIGFRPASPDGVPVIGLLGGRPGIVVATGLGPSGLTLGPYVGALAAGLARGEPPPLDLTPFGPERFAAG
jgi:D-amino-acid dehydrogenase